MNNSLYFTDLNIICKSHQIPHHSTSHVHFRSIPHLFNGSAYIGQQGSTYNSALARLRRLHFSFWIFLLFFVLVVLRVTNLFDFPRQISIPAGFENRFGLTAQTNSTTMSTGINAIRVPAKGVHSASIIWLHGLGDSGIGWRFISRMYDLPVSYNPMSKHLY